MVFFKNPWRFNSNFFQLIFHLFKFLRIALHSSVIILPYYFTINVINLRL